MPIDANFLPGVLSYKPHAAEQVFTLGNRLEMVRIDAAPVPAKMVKL